MASSDSDDDGYSDASDFEDEEVAPVPAPAKPPAAAATPKAAPPKPKLKPKPSPLGQPNLKPKPTPEASSKPAARVVPKPTPPKKKPVAQKTPQPPSAKRTQASPKSKVIGAPQESPKSKTIAVAPVNQIITAPGEANEQIFEDRIVDASGKTIRLDSPRLKKAFIRSGVVVEELQPVPMKDFVKEAEAQGLPTETGMRRFYAFESTRQGALEDLLMARKQIAAELAKNRWAGAGEKLTTIRRMFDMIDADKSGSLELPEFTVLIKSLGLNMLPHEISSTFKAMDKDGGGEIDFDEFTEFYMDAEDAGRASKGKRLGKEMIANLHAYLFNASIAEAKSKMGVQMLKERSRYQQAVKRLEDAERTKQNAHLEVEKRKAEHADAMRRKEKETIAVYEKAVKETFDRKKEKDAAEAARVEKARKDLVKQLKADEEEKARRQANYAEDMDRSLRANREHSERLKRKQREKKERMVADEAARARRLIVVQEEEEERLQRVAAKNKEIAMRNKRAAAERAALKEKHEEKVKIRTSNAARQFEAKLESLDTRLKYWEEDRVKSLSARQHGDQLKLAAIKEKEAADEEKRLNLAWQVQGAMESAEKRRLKDLALKSEESKLWLQTRMAKLQRAQRRKEQQIIERTEALEDKHAKMDAALTQKAEFDRKRKQLAQDAATAKLKMKHKQERDFFLMQQGRKPKEHDAPDKVFREFEQMAQMAEDRKAEDTKQAAKKAAAMLMM